MWEGLEGCVELGRYAATIPAGARRRTAYLEAGRGCPFRCTFCATAPFWQQRYRTKSVGRLVAELEYLHSSFGYDSFIFVHDLLTVSRAFVAELSDAIMDSRLPLEWMANSRVDLSLAGLVPRMKAAGCWKLFFGVETASSRLQGAIGKRLQPSAAETTVAELRENGISATCSFVIGMPDEQPEELSASIALGARLKLHGAETVQFHRLRLFPPSPMSRKIAPGSFDLASLRIEYPFVQVPDADIAEIRGDAMFFSGYFPPPSSAGTPDQLAQVEMFFQHAIAVLPLTVAALSVYTGGGLVPSFYRALERLAPVERASLDWAAGDLWGNWLALAPLLRSWIGEEAPLAAWEREVVAGILDYEEQRLGFVSGRGAGAVLARGPDWVAFATAVDVRGLPEALARCDGPGREVLASRIVVLVRRGARHEAYDLEPARRADLLARDPELLRVMEGVPA
jgi:hypothetical protein